MAILPLKLLWPLCIGLLSAVLGQNTTTDNLQYVDQLIGTSNGGMYIYIFPGAICSRADLF